MQNIRSWELISWKLVATLLITCVPAIAQQQAPAIGYMYPSGGQAGTTLDVVLGGYDWTPDIELFVHDSEIRLELTGSAGPVIVPEPPYWFEKKARRPPFLMPRERPARLTIPRGTKPGVYRWQAANANGATATGRFIVSELSEVREEADRAEPQSVNSLPVVVSGQIRKIEEVDRYRFTTHRDGPISISLVAAAIGSPLTAAVEVRDDSGELVAEAADTDGNDLFFTFAAKAAQAYVASIYDVDFRGNRSFVYRMTITPTPHVVAAIPAAGKRGETRDVEFIGYGIASGGAMLESLTQSVAFPNEPTDSFTMRLKTPFGLAEPISLLLSDVAEVVELDHQRDEASPLAIPSAVTGVLEQRYAEDRYVVSGTKGEVWALDLKAKTIRSELDVALSVRDSQGKELARSDDLPGTTDTGLEFVVPADGSYELIVSDSSGLSGNRAATYRLAVQRATPGFTLSGPEFVNVPLGGKTILAIKATRIGGFKEAINLQIDGLPEGVSVPEGITIPAGKADAKVELSASAEAGTIAAMLKVLGEAVIGEQHVVEQTTPVLLAVTMKPPFSIDAEGKDDVTKWPRGTTFPGPVLIQRDEGFTGEIVLEMAAKQGRHRQGIRGPELTVPPDVSRILYPVFLPEWLETTRTSRMVVNGVAQVADPKGRVRYLSTKLQTRIGFLPTGALLKIDCDVPEIEAYSDAPFEIPLTINRAKQLVEPVQIEIVDDRESQGLIAAKGLMVEPRQSHLSLSVTPLVATGVDGEKKITIRATVLQDEQYPVVSETCVLVVFRAAPE